MITQWWLVEAGVTVHAALRNPKDATKIAQVKAMSDVEPGSSSQQHYAAFAPLAQPNTRHAALARPKVPSAASRRQMSRRNAASLNRV